MMVPDEVVIEALLKDAKRFKSKWELHSSEPIRSKPNIKFLNRTLSNVVKINQHRMRQPRPVESVEKKSPVSQTYENPRLESEQKKASNSHNSSRGNHKSISLHQPKKSKHCKSKYRPPEDRDNRSSKHSKEDSKKRKGSATKTKLLKDKC